MTWSLPIGELFGIHFRAHLIFILIGLLSAFRFSEFGATGFLFGLVVVMLLVVSVAIHELGHAMVARAVGMPVRAVLLLPLGGVSDTGRYQPRPFQEFAVAATGPAASVAVAGAWLALAAVSGIDLEAAVAEVTPTWSTLLALLVSANILLGTLNLLPLFPLDGGRMVRALLSWPLGRNRGTIVTTWAGQGFAIAMTIAGLVMMQPFLAIVAAMFFISAARERSEVRARGNLSQLTAGELWERGSKLEPGTPLSELAGSLLRSSQRAFPVFLGDQLLGVVVRKEALASLERLEDNPYVASIMRRTVPKVPPELGAEMVLDMMTVLDIPVVAVEAEEGELLGFITQDRLAEAARGA